MCRVLEVSVSGFYAWRKRPMSARKREDGVLSERIVEIFQTHRGVYESPRIHAVLHDQGIHCGRKRVVRLMRQARISAHCRTHRVVTTRANPQDRATENVLSRDFQAERPNEKWAADVTYIAAAGRWMYLAVVLDLFSRRIVGWAMAGTQDEGLVARALHMALVHRKRDYFTILTVDANTRARRIKPCSKSTGLRAA
jgi:putative transposase